MTRALEVVSTVKLQKLKVQAEHLRAYVLDTLAILAHIGDDAALFSLDDAQSTERKRLAIVVTSERWLCGGLNSKLMRQVSADHKQDANVDYFVIGKKGLEFLKRMKANIVWSINVSDKFLEEELLPLYTMFDESIAKGNYWRVDVYFNYFKNVIVQQPVQLPLYPLSKESFDTCLEQLEIEYSVQPDIEEKALIIEPTKEEFVAEIRRQIRNYLLSAAIVQNKAGEHAARMIAMKNAKDNATGFVKHLKLTFNKARQAAITQEISEIVSAKIAIEG